MLFWCYVCPPLACMLMGRPFSAMLAGILCMHARGDDHNTRIWKLLVSYSQADTATLSNVLNVIRERHHRLEALRVAAQALGNRGICYITVYVGDRSGKGKRTTKGWQCHRALKTYLKEVRSVFESASIQEGVIVAFNTVGSIVRARSTRG